MVSELVHQIKEEKDKRISFVMKSTYHVLFGDGSHAADQQTKPDDGGSTWKQRNQDLVHLRTEVYPLPHTPCLGRNDIFLRREMVPVVS